MTGLTLKQLRRARKVIQTAKKFQHLADTDVHVKLAAAEFYLTGEATRANLPQDPREVLDQIGYKR